MRIRDSVFKRIHSVGKCGRVRSTTRSRKARRKSRHRRFDRCVRVMSAVVVGVGELAVMLDPAIYKDVIYKVMLQIFA